MCDRSIIRIARWDALIIVSNELATFYVSGGKHTNSNLSIHLPAPVLSFAVLDEVAHEQDLNKTFLIAK